MAKKKSIEDYFNYTQPDIDVPEWFKPTAKTKADSLPQTPMMSLLSAVIGPEEYEKEMGMAYSDAVGYGGVWGVVVG